jgi:hypothetical protein
VKEFRFPSFFQLLVLNLNHLNLTLFLLSSSFHLHPLHFSSLLELLPLFFSLPFTLLELFSLHSKNLLLPSLDFLYFRLFFKPFDLTLFLLSLILFFQALSPLLIFAVHLSLSSLYLSLLSLKDSLSLTLEFLLLGLSLFLLLFGLKASLLFSESLLL